MEIDGKTYFVASDVAKALGYQNTSKAINDHCKGITKRYIPTNGGMQEMNVIPEGDIFRLAANSDLPGAAEFESWIFDVVIPQIRKTGSYSLKPQCIEDLIIMQAQSMKELRIEVKQLQSTQQAIKAAVISEPDNWREDINHKVNKISQAIGSDKFREVRTESYKLLEQRAHVDLERRLNNYRGNLIKAGSGGTAVSKANKLDVIEQDPKLREIYGKIVGEYVIRYVA
jgi:prophage antirepressor-like protein